MNKNIFNFKDRTAVITGGAQGFGLDIARRFLDSGAKVIIWDIDSKMLEKATKDLNNPKYYCLKSYIGELHKCYLEYQKEWLFLKSILKNIHIGSFNIQKYSPGDHFSKPHSERTSLSGLHRLFAWMTYLNDVDDGGQTNFNHYGIKIKPETGKTLIWPAEWTHAHTGEILKSGKKYIVTGWMHFPIPDEEQNK